MVEVAEAMADTSNNRNKLATVKARQQLFHQMGLDPVPNPHRGVQLIKLFGSQRPLLMDKAMLLPIRMFILS